MVNKIFQLLLFFFCVSSFSYAQDNGILNYYVYADSVIQFPAMEESLTIVCQRKIDNRYVTFVGVKHTNKVILAAITPQPITDIEKNISLFVEFKGAIPSVGKTASWGYVYDRNHDGKIDYLAELAGAAAIEKDDVPPNYPKRKQHHTRDQLEIFVSHCSLIFNHWADDNYDEKLDAVIHIDMDPDRDWVKRRIVIRSTKYDGRFDDVWAFAEEHGDEPQTISSTYDKVQYHPIGKKKEEISKKTFQFQTDVLKLINRASKICGLTGKSYFPKLPEDE